MNNSEFVDLLRTTAERAINEYRSDYPEAPPLYEHGIDESQTRTINRNELEKRFTQLSTFFDELLDVDTSSLRNEWTKKIMYDCSLEEFVTIALSNPPSSLFLSGGMYDHKTGYIGISRKQLSDPQASDILASELVHCYQHQLESPTWEGMYLREGFEHAASCKGLEYLGETLKSELMNHMASRKQTEVLVKSFILYSVYYSKGVDRQDLQELGLQEDAIYVLKGNYPERILGPVKPRFWWSYVHIHPQYDMIGGLLLASENYGMGDKAYRSAFHGNHPWQERIEDLRHKNKLRWAK